MIVNDLNIFEVREILNIFLRNKMLLTVGRIPLARE